jgi:S1-C subfamily serine protease
MKTGAMLASCLALALPRMAQEAQREAAADAVVYVRVLADLKIEYPYGGRPPIVKRDVEIASGSGFVLNASGLVLTSRHVVAEPPLPEGRYGEGARVRVESRRIEVLPGTGQPPLVASLAAQDKDDDLAALQVTASDLAYLPLGDSDAIEAGRPVRVLGFPYGRMVDLAKRLGSTAPPAVTVTNGSFSAARTDDLGDTQLLQTDAAMYPGNSGGPLLDEDGYAVGVVRMKLSMEGAGGEGAGFAVAINVVKDFLDRSGLAGQMPVARLAPGAASSIDWKGLRLALPDVMQDRSQSRVRVVADDVAELSFHAFRVASDLKLAALEEVLLQGRELAGFVPGPAVVARRRNERGEDRRARLVGTAFARDAAGQAQRLEYALLDLGREKVLARFMGPSDVVAYNLGVVRASLASLEADALLAGRPAAEPPLAFTTAFLDSERTIPVPTGWTTEPDESGGCTALPPPAASLVARHPSDFRVTLRARLWERPTPRQQRAAAECAGVHRSTRLGSVLDGRGVTALLGDALLLLDTEAPAAEFERADVDFQRWLAAIGVQKGPP